jgi:periplasmic divalent cation tolerance protein
MPSIILGYSVFDSNETAQAVGEFLVTQGLAACVHIDQVESQYIWQNKLCKEPEFRLWFKTLEQNVTAVERTILAKHPYDTPCILYWPVQTNAAYFDWVVAQLSAPSS